MLFNFAKFKRFLFAVSLMAGVIIGAGIFTLPFVFDTVGFITGLAYLAVFTLAFVVIHIMYAQIILKTPGREHRFAGYARFYFGRPGYYFAAFMTVVGAFFILAVYLLLSVAFLQPLGLPGGIFGLLIFWVLSSWPIFFNIDELALLEFISNLAILAIIFLIFFMALFRPFDTTLFKSLDIETFFLPFGLMFFALAGRTAIPQVIKYFRESETFSLGQSIIWGTVSAAVIYVIFVYAVLVLSDGVTPDSIGGLTNLPYIVLGALAILALVNLWNSYIIIGIDLKESLKLDLDLTNWQAGSAVIIAPLLIYFAGFHQFLPLIEFTGGLFLGLEGILIVLMWKKLVQYPFWEWLTFILMLVFVLAIGFQIYTFFDFSLMEEIAPGTFLAGVQ